MAASSSAISISAGFAANKVTIKSIAATALADLFSGSGKIIYQAKLDCTSNSGEDVYFKAVDKATYTPGSDVPDLVLKGYKGVVKTYSIVPSGCDLSSVGISVACVTEKGEAGTTPPTGTVDVVLLTS